MKNIIWLLSIIFGVGAGYYFGYDNGYENAVYSNKLEDESSVDGNFLVSTTKSALIGKWQSTQDAKLTREFKADGSAIDQYENDKPAYLSWVVFDSVSPDTKFDGYVEPNIPYLSLSNGRDEYLFFKISKATPVELEIIYTDREEAMVFKKIK